MTREAKKRLWAEMCRNAVLKEWVESDPVFRRLLAECVETFGVESVEMRDVGTD